MKPENPYKCTCKPSNSQNSKQPCFIWQEGFDAAIKWENERCEGQHSEGFNRKHKDCPECIKDLRE